MLAKTIPGKMYCGIQQARLVEFLFLSQTGNSTVVITAKRHFLLAAMMKVSSIALVLFSVCAPGQWARSLRHRATLLRPSWLSMCRSNNDAGYSSRRMSLKTRRPASRNLKTAPVIDGKLDDPVWKTAAVFGDFLQTQPGDNVKPSDQTEVLIGYDAKNIYFAFRAKEPRDKIRATVGRRDNVFDDDFVGMYIDTFNDQRQAYFVFLNPLGIQGDGVFTENNGEDQASISCSNQRALSARTAIP